MIIECQIIAREQKGFGEILFRASLQEIIPYVNHIIITDNECDDTIKDMYRTIIPQDKLTIVEIEGRHPFDYLRNAGMDKTSPDCNWVCFVDTDELFGKEIFDEAKQAAEEGANTCNVGLNHLCVAPCLIDSAIKHFHPRFFKKLPGAKFNGKLHEGPVHAGPTKMLKTKQIHFGYARPLWQIYLKWIWYNYLQDGHLDGLKLFLNENPTKTPNSFMQTAKSLIEYKGPWRALSPLVQKHGLTRDSWLAYLESVEDDTIWRHWQELFHEHGSWAATLDDMLEFVYKIKK